MHLSEREKEEIILNVTLFGDARSLLRKRIGKICPQLTDKQRESLSNLSYRGWGRLYKKIFKWNCNFGTRRGRVDDYKNTLGNSG